MKLSSTLIPILSAILAFPPPTAATPFTPQARCPPSTGGGTWRNLAPIPLYPRQEHITIALHPTSSLAILGGIVPTGLDPTQGLPPYNTTHIVQYYDTATNKWTTGPPMPVPLNHANAAYVNGKIYLLLGLEVAADGAWRGTDRSWVLDVKRGVWKELGRLPPTVGIARGSAAVGVHDGRIYLAGGMTVLNAVPGGEQDSVAGVVVFHTRTERWVVDETGRVPDLPGARDHAGVAVVDGTMYVLGGRDHGQENVRDTVFALDLESCGGRKTRRVGRKECQWVVRRGRLPTARGGLAAAAVGNKVYTFGGEGNPVEGSNGVFNQTEVYDVVRDSWEKLAPMKLPRHGTYAAAVDGKVYIPGGGVVQSAGPVDSLDVFEPCAGK